MVVVVGRWSLAKLMNTFYRYLLISFDGRNPENYFNSGPILRHFESRNETVRMMDRVRKVVMNRG